MQIDLSAYILLMEGFLIYHMCRVRVKLVANTLGIVTAKLLTVKGQAMVVQDNPLVRTRQPSGTPLFS